MSMCTCDDGHDEVCYACGYCPVCSVESDKADTEGDLEAANSRVEELESRVAELEADLGEAEEAPEPESFNPLLPPG